MVPGDNFVTKIFDSGIGPSDALVVVLSNVSIRKPWVLKELNAAVVKNIEERTRLIPVRLDRCEIPACLKDGTLHREIDDLDNYDAELERIVNAIFGQLDKPPLGELPAYVQRGVQPFDDLTPIDSTIFEQACHIAMEHGQTYDIEGEWLIAALKFQGISEGQIIESEEILDGRGYIDLYRETGCPHVRGFSITTYGFDQFATTRIPDWDQIVESVARILVRDVIPNKSHAAKHGVAKRTGSAETHHRAHL